MTRFQRCSSSFMKTAISLGVSPTGSADKAERRLTTSGWRIASAMAEEIFSAIGAGVCGGATIPNQATETKPERISDIAGAEGSDATRLSLPTASTLRRSEEHTSELQSHS